MIYLFTVAAPEGSGTKWLAEALTTEHSYCYHEVSAHWYPSPVLESLTDWLRVQASGQGFEPAQRRSILQAFPEYFARLWERARYGQFIVGNCDHYMLGWLPGLALLWPEMKFIFAIRNGINCVQSHLVHQPSIPSSVVAAWERRWQEEDYFTLCCHRWSEDMQMLLRSREWLSERKGQLLEVRLENVATDLSELRNVWDWIGIGKWEEYAMRNAKLLQATADEGTSGPRSIVEPEAIWMAWSTSQREVFRRVCAMSMAQARYQLPD